MTDPIRLLLCTVMLMGFAGCQAAGPARDEGQAGGHYETVAATPTQMPVSTLVPTVTPTMDAQNTLIIPVLCTLKGRPYTRYFSRDAAILFTWGWEAETREQIDDFLANSRTIVTLDGTSISEGLFYEIRNISDGNMQYEVLWARYVGVLSVGVHILVYDVVFANPVSDGEEQYGPGTDHESLFDKCQIDLL